MPALLSQHAASQCYYHFCRTRRLEAVKQLGVDRIVQLTFGSGPAACHLLLEFYAQVGGTQGVTVAAARWRVLRV